MRGVASALAHRWPAGLAPAPHGDPSVDPTEPLPQTDYVVIAWTAADARALGNVLTPGIDAHDRWHHYAHNYEALLSSIRPRAPARASKRLASWYRASIGTKSVLCIKSELHLNQDSISNGNGNGNGTATLPVADLFRQVIAEAAPRLVITTGTAGGTLSNTQLGDVVITRAEKFRLADEFRNAAFNGKIYRSAADIPACQLAVAAALLDVATPRLREPDFGPPTTRYPVRPAAARFR